MSSRMKETPIKTFFPFELQLLRRKLVCSNDCDVVCLTSTIGGLYTFDFLYFELNSFGFDYFVFTFFTFFSLVFTFYLLIRLANFIVLSSPNL